MHINRLPRLPLTIFEQHYARGNQSLARDRLEYCDLAADSQRRAYALVREQHALAVSRVERRNSALSDVLKQLLIYVAGGWLWIYNTAATIRQGAKSGTDASVLKEKLSLNWTGPFKILAVGPSPSDLTPDGRPLAAQLLYLDLPNAMPGPDAHWWVSVARCKPCTDAHDPTDLPQYLPAGLTQYVLSKYTKKSLPFHATADDFSVPVERSEVDKISSHRSVRGRGGAIAVLYETHWKGLLRPSWAREADLLHARQHILKSLAGVLLQFR